MDPKQLDRARALEKKGQLEAAAKLFREGGAVDDAARILVALKKPEEAGRLLYQSLQVEPAQVGQLSPQLKKRALMAAIQLGRAGEAELSVQLFLALGEPTRAAEVLQRAGDHAGAARLSLQREPAEAASLVAPTLQRLAASSKGLSLEAAQRFEQQGKLALALQAYRELRKPGEAARVAAALGQPAEAALLYAEAGKPYQAALAHLKAGDPARALESFARVPRDDAAYRKAAAQAIALAAQLEQVSFSLEHFLGPFLRTPPRGPEELEALYLLARLYLAHDLADNAREALALLQAAAPGYKDAEALLAGLLDQQKPSAALAQKMLDDAGRGARKAPRPPLQALPGLPDGPDLPGASTLLRGPLQPGVSQPGETLPEIEPLLESELIPEAGSGSMPAQQEAAPQSQAFEPGGVIAGRYRLFERIGQGGMAQVFRAADLELEEEVALKVFALPASSEVHIARFKQELKLSRQLIHPNIIRLYDIGLHNGYRYISMELLRGETLKTRMERPIEFATALGYLIHACAGLQAAHDAGVIHRDVKPDNFFVTEEGGLKILDFGIAKQFTAPGLTVAGSIAGTPLYMSPEQISNFSAVTAATDLYALGVCAYEMFAGAVPFEHEELLPLLMMHVNQAPEPPRARNPGIPEDLERVILKLLEKKPADRFGSCSELGKALSGIRARYIG